MHNKFNFSDKMSQIDAVITDGAGKKTHFHGDMLDMEVRTRGPEVVVYEISIVPKIKVRNDNFENEKRFSETRLIKVIVPQLTPGNIALAALQAGYGDNTSFEVEQVGNKFIVTFREECVSHE